MNIGDIKAFLRQEPQNTRLDSQRPDEALKQQLQESGLRQAVSLQQSFQASSSTSVFSSQRAIGVKVYNAAFSQNLLVNEQQYNGKIKESSEDKKSLFDFEEVAKNVLRFVGGVIKSAAANGADEAKLMDLFSQAREGVAKGVGMAKKDLSGLMNDEISEGIASSEKLIEEGIQRLQDKLFAKEDDEQEALSAIKLAQQASYSRSDSGELNIRTRDGDEVTIRFEDLERFELNRSLLLNSAEPTEQTDNSSQPTPKGQVSSIEAEVAESNESDQQAVQQAEQGKAAEQGQLQVDQQQAYAFFAKNDFSFSVQGELDENEMRAIAELVENANGLADEFFNGDVEQAFNQALELGFDEQELTGFALQLNKVEQVQVVQAYEEVRKYAQDDNNEQQQREKTVKPVADYLDKMLQTLEQSRNALEDGSQYEQLLNGLINQNTGLKMPELLDAINRFHSFNQTLLNNVAANSQA